MEPGEFRRSWRREGAGRRWDVVVESKIQEGRRKKGRKDMENFGDKRDTTGVSSQSIRLGGP